jgi:phosphopantothenoylcysteine decarboxylase/phosphopantothenate--cysteine ligase
MHWSLTPPSPSDLADRAVVQRGERLKGKHIALLISGSIAAYRTPDLVRDLRREGADVVVYASSEALRYVGKEALEWTSLHPVIDHFSPEAEHLSDSRPFDAYLLAPGTYSTINKIASGVADSVVTATLATALGRMEQQGVPVLIAPAMHGNMHNSILTASLKRLQEMGVRIVPPRQAHGKNNLASAEILVGEIIRALSQSTLRGKRLVITGGPTPVMLDNVRRITTVFTGSLSIELATEAWIRGAEVELILGKGSLMPPEFIETRHVHTYDEYRDLLLERLEREPADWGIFTAAVADYQPEQSFIGKLASGSQPVNIKLVPTAKVIQQVRERFQDLRMVTFKYEELVTHEELINIARKRIQDYNYQLVVANRGEDFSGGDQVAWLVYPDADPVRIEGKPVIAKAILDWVSERTA